MSDSDEGELFALRGEKIGSTMALPHREAGHTNSDTLPKSGHSIMEKMPGMIYHNMIGVYTLTAQKKCPVFYIHITW